MRIRTSICRLFVFWAFFMGAFSFGNQKKSCNDAFGSLEEAATRFGMKLLYPDAYEWLYGERNIPRSTQPIRPSVINPAIGGYRLHHAIEIPSQYKLALSQDGNLMAVADASSVTIQNTLTPGKTRTISFTDGNVSTSTLTFSPDGKQLAIAITEKPTPKKTIYQIAIWDIESGRMLNRIGSLKYPPTKLAFNPDGNRLGVIYAGTSDVEVWDLSQSLAKSVTKALGIQKPLAKFVAIPYAVDLAFTPTQNQNPHALTTLSLNEGSLSVWNYGNGKRISEIPNNGNQSQIHLGSKGDAMVMTSILGRLSVKNPETKEQRDLLEGLGQGESGRSALMSQDGRTLLLRSYPEKLLIFKK